jgi:hypothetical protein
LFNDLNMLLHFDQNRGIPKSALVRLQNLFSRAWRGPSLQTGPSLRLGPPLRAALIVPMRAIAEKLQDRLAYPPRLMDDARAAAYVGFGPTKFHELVDEGIMPSPVNIDGTPRWDRLELDGAVDNLKDRRRDPVTRDRDKLEQRIRAMEEGS